LADDKYLDEESKSPKKNKKKKSGPKPKAKAKPIAARSEPEVVEELDVPEQKISLFLAVGLIVSSLVVGLVVGYVVAPKGPSSDLAAPVGTGTAPSLTPEQLESTQLPASHPALPGTEEETDGVESDTETPEDSENENQSEQSDEKTE